jgi:hypothetical protein
MGIPNTTELAEERILPAYSVFPNPSSGFFQINRVTGAAHFKWIVADLWGRRIVEGSNTPMIDLSKELPGYYVLLIEDDSGACRQPIIRQ